MPALRYFVVYRSTTDIILAKTLDKNYCNLHLPENNYFFAMEVSIFGGFRMNWRTQENPRHCL
jgi:hypothetical protein